MFAILGCEMEEGGRLSWAAWVQFVMGRFSEPEGTMNFQNGIANHQ